MLTATQIKESVMPKITIALNVLLDSLILLDEKLMLISQTNFLKTRLHAHA